MALSNSHIRWLHISDFHFKRGKSYDADLVLNSFKRYLPALVASAGAPDVVFATGDIANTGHPEEYENATAFFDDILGILNLGRNRLFVVPGNHDIDRTIQPFLMRTVESPAMSDKYFDPSQPLPHLSSRQIAFSNWYNAFFSGIRQFSDNTTVMEPTEITIRDHRLVVQPINTSTFSYDDDDLGKLWIGRRCLDQLPNDPDENRFHVALLHHPLEWLHEGERQHVKQTLLETFDAVLTGHLHYTDTDQITGISGGSLFLAAGAMYQGSQWPNKAMIAGIDDDDLSIYPISYSDSPRPCWTLDPSIYPKGSGHVGRLPVRPSKASQANQLPHTSGESKAPATTENGLTLFEEELFITHSNKPLYVEPRLMPRPQIVSFDEPSEATPVSVSDIVASSTSYLIEARSEHGGTTLAKRLEHEINASKIGSAIRRDAAQLPNYKKKLQPLFAGFEPDNVEKPTLILDNINGDRDERLIRELLGLNIFGRIIGISMSRGIGQSSLIDLSSEHNFERLYLWASTRSDIRTLAQTLFETDDHVFCGQIVDKVYKDLLGLCIPLTPANIIMYLRVLHREGEFQPLNRVDILSRYVQESLRRPGDAYRDVFNHKNKIDVLSDFVFRMYQGHADSFDARRWYEVMSDYKKRTLVDFDAEELLQNLVDARIIVRADDLYFLRYSFFYSFFLGRYLASKSDALAEFLDNKEYTRMRGVIDVVTGISSDNNRLVRKITADVEQNLAEFFNTYISRDFDPMADAIWPDNDKEADELWGPIKAALDSAPRSSDEIDLLKTSLASEARTADQQVTFEKFAEIESAVFVSGEVLSDALRNSDDVDGDAKIGALSALLKVHTTAFQIGTLLAPWMAKRRVVRWGGVCFIDFYKAPAPDSDPDVAIGEIISAVCTTVPLVAAEENASTKLASVFRAGAMDEQRSNKFESLVLFHFILNAKGASWDRTLSDIIDKTERNSFYLWAQLQGLMQNLNDTVMLAKDRERVKRLVAQIQAKRTWNSKIPGEKAVSRMLDHLEKIKHFEDKEGV